MGGRKKTVSFGIPAYNEENNIKKLITTLLDQTHENYILDSILVVSDGSNDSTVQQVKSIKDKRIVISDYKDRTGKTIRQNEILSKTDADFLIFCDADITINKKNFVDDMMKKLATIDKFGVAGTNTTPTKADTFIEACINYSVQLQQRVREKWNKGNNFLSFRGSMLVLEKKYYKKLEIPNIVANDAYIYLKALQLGFSPVYFHNKRVYYKSPRTLQDHLKQTSRYKTSFEELAPYISDSEKSYFTIPKGLFIKVLLNAFLRNPLYMIGYLFIQLYGKIFTYNTGGMMWEVASSTKKI